MEEEARSILRETLAREENPPCDLAAAIRSRIKPLGGVDLSLPPRKPVRRPPDLDD
jgi:plasmid stability protein